MTRALAVFLLLAACSPPATLTEVQDQVFTPSCVFSTCHDAAGGGGLVLVKGKSWAQLVGTMSVGAPSRTRVIAGDTKTSYLVEKLTSATPAAGVQMPQTGDSVSSTQLELVKSWVEAGAKDN